MIKNSNKELVLSNSSLEQVSELLKEGLQKHQNSQLNEAEEIYNKILILDPNNFNTLQLLATIAVQTKKYETAIELFNNVISVKPDFAPAFNNCGVALKELERFDEAISYYNRAILIKPDYAEAYYNRGISLAELKRFNEALSSYSRAIEIKPDYVAAYCNRGNILRELKQFNEAISSYSDAITIKPDFAEAYSNRGIAFRELKRFEEALASYDRAIAIRPKYAEAHNNRGNTLKQLNRLTEALASYDTAIKIKPDYAEAHYNRGIILKELNRLDESLSSYDRAISLKPNYAEAYCNRGNALYQLNRPEDALHCYERAIEIKPNYAEALSNRGVVLHSKNQFNEALSSFDLAIKFDPSHADAHWNKSLTLLLNGSFIQGWQLYEWRWKSENTQLKPRHFDKPLWSGNETLSNKIILVHSEQGLGDTIQFCRYATLLKKMGASVLLETPKALKELLKTLNGVDKLIVKGQPIPPFDFHIPLLSLPLAFKTELETIPNSIPYLSASSSKVEFWEEKLGKKVKPRIGIVWSGSTLHKNDLNRSLSLKELFAYLPNEYEYVSLQKEVNEADRDYIIKNGLKHFGKELLDFSDTAALCNSMDLLISVDTSVAHLGGSIGKSTWILLPFSPDWRWLLDREDSPWYPTIKLYRQDKIGSWKEILHKLKSDLINYYK